MSLTVEVVLYACLIALAVMSWGIWSAEKEIEKLQEKIDKLEDKIDFLEDENDELDRLARHARMMAATHKVS